MPGVHVRRHKNIFWLILDTPPLNLLTTTMLEQLSHALREVLQHPPQLMVLTGAGEQAFCAGIAVADESNTQSMLKLAEECCQLFEEVRKHSIHSVGLVKGIAYAAGCELAALCDVVIAREDARFRLPAANARVFVSATAERLPAIIGASATTSYMQSGETINASTAQRLGLVHQLLPTHYFLSDTEELLVMLSTIKQLA